MKKIIMAVLVACIGGSAIAQSTPVTTSANPLWTDTGLIVTNGQSITVNTWGTGLFWPGATGADGVYNSSTDLFLNNGIQGGIIAYIGADPYQGHFGDYAFFPQNTGYWQLGCAAHFISNTNGELWLGINDDAQTTATGDNSGALQSHVLLGWGATNDFSCGPDLCGGLLTNSTFSFSITGTSNTVWAVYSSGDLINWVLHNTVTLDADGLGSFEDVAGVGYRFYKLDNGMCHSKAIGFVELTIPATNSLLLADQLISCAAPSNKVEVVLPSVPEGTILLKLVDGTPSTFITNTFSSGVWGNPNMTLDPGEGGFLYNPTTNPITIVFTGQVPEGHLLNPVPHGWSVRSSIVPQAGPIASFLGFPKGNGDFIYQYRAPIYIGNDYIGGEWEGDNEGAEPVIKVGEAFQLYNNSSADNWIREFSIWRTPSP